MEGIIVAPAAAAIHAEADAYDNTDVETYVGGAMQGGGNSTAVTIGNATLEYEKSGIVALGAGPRGG